MNARLNSPISRLTVLNLSLFLAIACQSEPAASDDTAETGSGDSTETGSSSESGESNDGTGDTEEPAAEAQDYRETGPFSVTSTTQTIEVGSCSMDITLFEPQAESPNPLIILAHGFARSPDNMVGWGEHYASWGFQVATPKLCHASIWDADHSTNANDLIDLGQALSSEGVIYAGQSAGGLAALLAAGRDGAAEGVLGLDATDSESIGVVEASSVSVPVFGLVGEASDCNSDNNGLEIYAAIDAAQVLRVTEADHCDFESDTDFICTSFCQGSNSRFTDEQIQSAILGLSTAALLTIAGHSEAGSSWWNSTGEHYAELNDQGIISSP